MKYQLSLPLIIILILVNIEAPVAIVQIIPMQKLGEDTIGDEGDLGLDIAAAFAGSFNGLLVLTVVYQELPVWSLYSNTTLRNANGELFLIVAGAYENSGFVLVTGSNSLEDDSLNVENNKTIGYEEEWRAHANTTELTFFVDWTDIGGEGPIDLVFWTGRPRDNPDKLPDTSYLSFNGVEYTDTTGFMDDTVSAFTSDNQWSEIITDNNSNHNFTTSSDTEEETTFLDFIPISNSYILGIIVTRIIFSRKSKNRR